jgi:hypothetical protein
LVEQGVALGMEGFGSDDGGDEDGGVDERFHWGVGALRRDV